MLSVALVLVATAVTGILWSLAERRIEQLKHAEKLRDRFFSLAERLITDPRTPGDLVPLLLRLGSGMVARGLPFWLCLISLTRKGRSVKTPPESWPTPDQLPEELFLAFAGAIVCGLLAISYQSVLFGPQIRRHVVKAKKDRRDTQAQTRVRRLAWAVNRIECRHEQAA
jgi:hypothetical protein